MGYPADVANHSNRFSHAHWGCRAQDIDERRRIDGSHASTQVRELSHEPDPILLTVSTPAIMRRMPQPGKESFFRMHDVWRCRTCRFKTDCCDW